jgi:hypothetical protein
MAASRRRAAHCRASRTEAGPSANRSHSKATTTSAFERSWRGATSSAKASSAPRRWLSRETGSLCTQRALGKSFRTSASCAARVGEITLPVRMRSPAPPFCFWASRSGPKADTKSSQVALRPLRTIVVERSGSYRSSTEAWVNRSVPPRLATWSGLPSHFVGRPMWLSTKRPMAPLAQGMAVAKYSGLPGIRDSGDLA